MHFSDFLPRFTDMQSLAVALGTPLKRTNRSTSPLAPDAWNWIFFMFAGALIEKYVVEPAAPDRPFTCTLFVSAVGRACVPISVVANAWLPCNSTYQRPGCALKVKTQRPPTIAPVLHSKVLSVGGVLRCTYMSALPVPLMLVKSTTCWKLPRSAGGTSRENSTLEPAAPDTCTGTASVSGVGGGATISLNVRLCVVEPAAVTVMSYVPNAVVLAVVIVNVDVSSDEIDDSESDALASDGKLSLSVNWIDCGLPVTVVLENCGVIESPGVT